MVNYYDELEIEDFAWDPIANVFHYPCPCGDRFEISKSQLRDGEEIAICPSCSLIVRVIYDYLDWEDYATSAEEDEEAEDDAQAESESESPDTSASPVPVSAEQVKLDARHEEGGDELSEEMRNMQLRERDKDKDKDKDALQPEGQKKEWWIGI